jgi:hypothetical protein
MTRATWYNIVIEVQEAFGRWALAAAHIDDYEKAFPEVTTLAELPKEYVHLKQEESYARGLWEGKRNAIRTAYSEYVAKELEIMLFNLNDAVRQAWIGIDKRWNP